MNARVVTALCLMIATAARPALADWQGRELVKDGVTHVMNPEAPLEGVTVELEELWRVGGDDEEMIFGVIMALEEDEGGAVYVLDTQLSQIHVYSEDGEYLRTIGREGEGPGEFRNSADMYLGFESLIGVIQVFPGKIVQLTTAGDPAGTFPLPQGEGAGFQLVFLGSALEDRVVLAGSRMIQQEGKQLQTTYLKAFDAGGNELAHYCDRTEETRFGGMTFVEGRFTGFERRWALAPDGRVAAAPDFDAYRIQVWNPDGTLDRIIERDGFEPVKRTDAEKERFHRMYMGLTRWSPGSTFEVSETHMTVNQIAFRDDGSMWVLSSRGIYERAEGALASFDVYDRNGRYTRRVALRAGGDPVEDTILFGKDRVYVITDVFSAFMSTLGGEGDVELGGEPEPVSVIAYRMGPERVRK